LDDLRRRRKKRKAEKEFQRSVSQPSTRRKEESSRDFKTVKAINGSWILRGTLSLIFFLFWYPAYHPFPPFRQDHPQPEEEENTVVFLMSNMILIFK